MEKLINSQFTAHPLITLKTGKLRLNFGFTLVELLVAIGIIATILAVIVPNFMGARERARDVRRKRNLASIQKALELYKIDRNPQEYYDSAFPSTSCGQCWTYSGFNDTCAANENIYLRKFPCDPLAPTPYTYIRGIDILTYTLTACLENPVDPDRDNPVVAPCDTGTGVSYTITEP